MTPHTFTLALPDGRCTVFWTALSPSDQQVERGTITFNVTAAGTTAIPSPTATPRPSTDERGGPGTLSPQWAWQASR